MKWMPRLVGPIALGLALGGCSLGGMLGGGGKAPPTLLTLTHAKSPRPIIKTCAKEEPKLNRLADKTERLERQDGVIDCKDKGLF